MTRCPLSSTCIKVKPHRHVEAKGVWKEAVQYEDLVDDDPALTSWELKKKDLNVFRFGRGGRGPIDALRKRIRSWAHKRRDWTPSPLLFLAYVRRHALYLGEDEGWALEPEPLVGLCKPAVGDDACVVVRPVEKGNRIGVFIQRGGAAKRQPVRRDFGDMSWCDLALRHGVCRDRVHPRDVCCVEADRVERLLKIDDGSRITFYAEAPGPQFPFCTTLADGEAAYCCRLAACRALNIPGDVACAKAPLPQEYAANGGIDEALLQSYEEAETHGTAGFCGFIALKVARFCERIEAHPACADLYDRVIDVCERVEADCDGDPMPEEENESAPMTPSDLLALNDDWELTNPRALLRALRLDEDTHKQAMRGLRLPAHAAIAKRSKVLTASQCAALRAVAEARASSKRDTVDGLPDRQVNLDVAELESIIGAAARDKLWRTIGRHYKYDVECFLRAYAPGTQRTDIPFHCDAAHVTANVALCDDGELYAVAGGQLVRIRRKEGDVTLHDSSLLHAVRAVDKPRHSLILFFREKAAFERPEDFYSSCESSEAERDDGEKEKARPKALPPPAPEKTGPKGGLPSDAALEAMTGTQLRKLMARRGVGRGPQDRKEDFIDKLKAHAAGETYVNKPNPYKRAPVRKRARAPPRRKAPVNTGGLRLGSRVWAFGKRGTITELPGDNGWWRVQLDGENGTRGARIGSMRALGGAAVPPPPPSSSPAPPKVEEKTTVKWGKIEDVPWG